MNTDTDLQTIIAYIIRFLLYGNAEMTQHVGYTTDENEWTKYRVVIVPNGHLGKRIVLPDMRHPILEHVGKTLVIRTDIVYNTFFFISRAEELVNQERDEHGRFCAKHSLLGQGNRLQIPIIDEYAHIVMKHLEMDIPIPHYAHIYLTHDIDTIARYRHLRGALGGIYRGQMRAVLHSLANIKKDPVYTFPWLIEEDARVPKAEVIYFVKHTAGKGFDYPQYSLHGRDFQHLQELLKNSGAKMGLHSSYYGGVPHRTTGTTLHRSHYLNCPIEQMERLTEAGMTDDFSMSFPDQVGFRLQTTRAVRWINPKTMQLTSLTLHPLTVMDCTLSNNNYMNLQTEGEAYFCCEQIFDKVRQYSGDICLLWHNSIFTSTNYHMTLYTKLLNGLRHYSK
ncbi:MAG: hypothetical protein NC038_06790 [Paludibacter sp.]|nr:hypothetical protein [Bacteroidales bacterium]MCM1069607.1 hypothetical protein [Prevotella sp.]MCM1354253.1 hypothetical protein [Bacteroides sp.]MCM1443092.1 hypothetical protein [Muribaculum sp.]MCM1482327.1 hypothetical protein [Paludibacter sp.]